MILVVNVEERTVLKLSPEEVAVYNKLDVTDKATFLKALDQRKKEGKEKGIKLGTEKGRKEGKEEGKEEGIKEERKRGVCYKLYI